MMTLKDRMINFSGVKFLNYVKFSNEVADGMPTSTSWFVSKYSSRCSIHSGDAAVLVLLRAVSLSLFLFYFLKELPVLVT